MSTKRTLLLAAVISLGSLGSLDSGTAFAQPAETTGAEAKPDHGFAPPSDEGPPDHNGSSPEKQRIGTAAPGTEEESHDPSKHFNFFGFDYRGKDEYGGKLGDSVMIDPATGKVVVDEHGKPAEEEPMSAPFVLMVFNFLVLMALLVWKGGPVARKLARERHDAIKTALDEAAKLRKQAADKLAEYEARLKDADAEIKQLVEGMRKDAEADKVRILENAAKQAAQLQKEAELRIAAEIELARASLTREVTIAATTATEKLLRDKMMPADQQKLVTTFISDVQHVPQPKERA
jgi:F-type H+-transporting ATPase subunit b